MEEFKNQDVRMYFQADPSQYQSQPNISKTRNQIFKTEEPLMKQASVIIQPDPSIQFIEQNKIEISQLNQDLLNDSSILQQQQKRKTPVKNINLAGVTSQSQSRNKYKDQHRQYQSDMLNVQQKNDQKRYSDIKKNLYEMDSFNKSQKQIDSKLKSMKPSKTMSAVKVPREVMQANQQPEEMKEAINYQVQESDNFEKLIHEYDFDHIFYDREKVKIVGPCVDAINKLNIQDQQFLKKQVKSLGTSYVLAKLREKFPATAGQRQSDLQNIEVNKVKWAQQFMTQPHVQQVVINYFEQLDKSINTEVHHNSELINNYLKFPRNQKACLDVIQSNKESRVLQETVASRTRSCLTAKQQRDFAMNQKLQKQRALSGYKNRKFPEDEEIDIVSNTGSQNLHPVFIDDQMNQPGSLTSQMLNQNDSKLNEDQKANPDLVKSQQLSNKQQTSHQGGTQGSTSWTSSGIEPKFLNKLPKVLRKKNAQLITDIKDYINEEVEARKQYNAICREQGLLQDKMYKFMKMQEAYLEKERAKKKQKTVANSILRVQEKIAQIENEGNELELQIGKLEEQSNLVSISRKNPTEKLMTVLDKWDKALEKEHMDQKQQENFENEYWKITQNFEEEIRQEVKGWEMERDNLTAHWKNHEQKLKNGYLFRIEALESALEETKMHAQSQYERYEMEINDMESKQMNLEIKGFYKDVNNFIRDQQEIIGDLNVKKLGDFQEAINLEAVARPTRVQIVYDTKNKNQNSTVSLQQTMEKQSSISSFSRMKDFQDPGQSVFIPQKTTEQLNDKLNKYFKMIKHLHSQVRDNELEIENQKQKVQIMQEKKDFMHLKCVKYQDLAFGLIQMTSSLLGLVDHSNQKIVDEVLFKFEKHSEVEDLKITLPVKEIESIIKTIDSINLDEIVQTQIINKKLIVQKIETLEQLNEDLNNIEWLSKRQEILHKLQEEPKAAKQHKKGCANEMNYEMQEFISLVTDIQLNIENLSLLNIEGPESQNKSNNILSPLSGVSKLSNMTFDKNLVKQASVLKNQPTKKQGFFAPESHKFVLKNMATRIQEGVERGMKTLKSKNSKDPNALKRRMTFFGDNADIVIKSISKRKIYYQFDQILSEEDTIKRSTMKNFLAGLKKDPIARKLLYADHNADLDSEEEDDHDEQLLNNILNDNESPIPSVMEQTSFDEKLDFDDIIKQINIELQHVFKLIQAKQFTKLATSMVEDQEDFTSYSSQTVYPVDVVKIEPYMPPQLNIVPLKLIMLQGNPEFALKVMSDSLKHITNFFAFDNIKDRINLQEREKLVHLRLNLKSNLGKHRQIQCNLTHDEGGLKCSSYPVVSGKLIDSITRFVDDENQKLIDLGYDQQDADANNDFLIIVRQSLRVNHNYDDLIKDLNTKYQDLKEKQIGEVKQEVQGQLDRLKAIEREYNTFKMEQLSKSESIDSPPQQQVTSQDETPIESVIDKKSSLSKSLSRGKSVHIDAGRVSQTRLDSETSVQNSREGMIRLARQDELLERALVFPDISQDPHYNQIRPHQNIQPFNMEDQETTLNYQKSVLLEEKFPESIQTVVIDKAIQTESPEKDILSKFKPIIRKVEEDVQTEVSMSDIQMTLEFKRRAVQKIKSLEEIIRMLKMDKSKSTSTQHTSASRPQSAAYVLAPQREVSNKRKHENKIKKLQELVELNIKPIERNESYSKLQQYRLGAFMIAPRLLQAQDVILRQSKSTHNIKQNRGLTTRKYLTAASPKNNSVVNFTQAQESNYDYISHPTVFGLSESHSQMLKQGNSRQMFNNSHVMTLNSPSNANKQRDQDGQVVVNVPGAQNEIQRLMFMEALTNNPSTQSIVKTTKKSPAQYTKSKSKKRFNQKKINTNTDVSVKIRSTNFLPSSNANDLNDMDDLDDDIKSSLLIAAFQDHNASKNRRQYKKRISTQELFDDDDSSIQQSGRGHEAEEVKDNKILLNQRPQSSQDYGQFGRRRLIEGEDNMNLRKSRGRNEFNQTQLHIAAIKKKGSFFQLTKEEQELQSQILRLSSQSSLAKQTKDDKTTNIMRAESALNQSANTEHISKLINTAGGRFSFNQQQSFSNLLKKNARAQADHKGQFFKRPKNSKSANRLHTAVQQNRYNSKESGPQRYEPIKQQQQKMLQSYTEFKNHQSRVIEEQNRQYSSQKMSQLMQMNLDQQDVEQFLNVPVTKANNRK